jgi:hypothetical protein
LPAPSAISAPLLAHAERQCWCRRPVVAAFRGGEAAGAPVTFAALTREILTAASGRGYGAADSAGMIEMPETAAATRLWPSSLATPCSACPGDGPRRCRSQRRRRPGPPPSSRTDRCCPRCTSCSWCDLKSLRTIEPPASVPLPLDVLSGHVARAAAWVLQQKPSRSGSCSVRSPRRRPRAEATRMAAGRTDRPALSRFVRHDSPAPRLDGAGLSR